MLRVRPVHFTQRPEAFFELFDALGLVRLPGSEDAADWIEFDAGSGRLALHRVDAHNRFDGVTKLGFEVKDVAEFTERTKAELPEHAKIRTGSEDFGDFAVITAADDVVLQADQSTRPDQTPGVGAQLRVQQVWYTDDVPGACQTLQAMGAVLVTEADNGEYADFAAPNGGTVTVYSSSLAEAGGLAFSYAGNTEPVRDKLKDLDIEAYITEEKSGRILHVANPDEERLDHTPTGATIWIDEALDHDDTGYTAAE